VVGVRVTDRVYIFDTTLRDGEQSPGFSMTVQEKLEMARALARLGVDVIEAGFPIASPGDLEAVRLIAREVRGPVICGLARAQRQDIEVCWEEFGRRNGPGSTPSSPPPPSTWSASCG